MSEASDTSGEALGLLPVYIVVDTSASMNAHGSSDGTGPRLIDVANEIVPAVVEVCEVRPSVKDRLRLCLISFGSTAQVVVPLGMKDDFVPPPVLTASGGTNYGEAFRLLRSEIEDGVRALNLGGYKVFRPAVFFITDGEPIDDPSVRAAAFAELTDPGFPASPHIVMFGVADASPETLKAYINRNGVAVAAKAGADAAEALHEMLDPLVSSIVTSMVGGAAGGADDGTFQFDPGAVNSDLLVVFG